MLSSAMYIQICWRSLSAASDNLSRLATNVLSSLLHDFAENRIVKIASMPCGNLIDAHLNLQAQGIEFSSTFRFVFMQ